MISFSSASIGTLLFHVSLLEGHLCSPKEGEELGGGGQPTTIPSKKLLFYFVNLFLSYIVLTLILLFRVNAWKNKFNVHFLFF
jgi:hypothetical protein